MMKLSPAYDTMIVCRAFLRCAWQAAAVPAEAGLRMLWLYRTRAIGAQRHLPGRTEIFPGSGKKGGRRNEI